MPTALRFVSASAMVLVLLAGCASDIPRAIREPSASSPVLAEVQRRPDAFIGRHVRWGGTILAVHNQADSTLVELLARPLDRDGEPDSGANGLGRFMAELEGFQDPTDYPKDRRLTVAGLLVRTERRPVGDFPYLYPVVAVQAQKLWSEPPPRPLYPAPYYPWYDPWGRPPYPGPWYGPWY